MSCKRIQRLIESYVDGAASTDERRAVETHVAECSPCAKNLETSQRLLVMLQGAPERKVDTGFETRLFAALRDQVPAPSRAAWWERFRLQFEWRLRTPTMMTACALAVTVIGISVVAPPVMQTQAGKEEVLASTVEQHKQLQARMDVSPDAVEAGIELITGPTVNPIE